MEGHAPPAHEVDEPPVGARDLVAADLASAPLDRAVLDLDDQGRGRKTLAVQVLVDDLLEPRLALGNRDAPRSPFS